MGASTQSTAVRWLVAVVAVLAVIALIGYARGDDSDDGRAPEQDSLAALADDPATSAPPEVA